MPIWIQAIVCEFLLCSISGFRTDREVEVSLLECHVWCFLLFYCAQSDSWYDPNASKCPTHTHIVPLYPLSCQRWGSSMSDREPEHGLTERGRKDDFTGLIICKPENFLYILLCVLLVLRWHQCIWHFVLITLSLYLNVQFHVLHSYD